MSGRIVIEAELDTGIAARRLRKDILEIFGHSSDLVVMAPGGLRRGSRYVVRVVAAWVTSWRARRASWTAADGPSGVFPAGGLRGHL